LLPFYVIAITGFERVSKSEAPNWFKLVLSVVLLVFLQVIFGIAAGEGIESLRQKYASREQSQEVRTACEYRGSIRGAIVNYEDNFADHFWFGTKPPGLFAFFMTVRAAAQSVIGEDLLNIDECQRAVTQLMAFIFPLLAATAILPVYLVSKLLGQDRYPHDSGLLFMTVPAVVLMPLVRDQAIYPLLAAAIIAVSLRAAISRSLWLALIAGVMLYFAAFLSFSLLPLAAIVYAFPAARALRGASVASLRPTVVFMVAVTAGILAAWLVGELAFNYDPIGRYEAAMELHRTIKGFRQTLQALPEYARLNSWEFVMAGGAPLILLSIASMGPTAYRSVHKSATDLDSFGIATFGAVMVLFLAGQARGEVARLWLFLFVPISLFAAPLVRSMNDLKTNRLRWMLAMQLLISVFTFLNMDFR
jgi:hypothetical protein